MALERDFYTWIATRLRPRGYQISKSGFKLAGLGNHAIDPNTGNWLDLNYSRSKPPRWLFNFALNAGTLVAGFPGGGTSINVGNSNTAQGDKAALAVKILPIFDMAGGQFIAREDLELQAVFIFPTAIEAGSSSDSFAFDRQTGRMSRANNNAPAVPYIFAALIGLRPEPHPFQVNVNGVTTHFEYRDIGTAIQAAVQIELNGNLVPIPYYDLSNGQQAILQMLEDDVDAAIQANAVQPPAAAVPLAVVGPAIEVADEGNPPIDLDTFQVPRVHRLIGIDDSVYRQIEVAIRSRKQHLMFYGPPGTGKTSMAELVAETLSGNRWVLITGSADWTSQDVIGGYQPIGGGLIAFVPGVLLRHFDQPLIFDELNRCDIDKVLGPLFTVLSGHATSLPYRVDVANRNSALYTIFAEARENLAEHQFAPTNNWRIIATINSVDRGSLYQMSYALVRRFAWIYFDVPSDLTAFLTEYVQRAAIGNAVAIAGETSALAGIWAAINAVRPIGPAPIIDIIKTLATIDPAINVLASATAAQAASYFDGFYMYVLPMMDGILMQDAEQLITGIAAALGLPDDSLSVVDLAKRLKSVAV